MFESHRPDQSESQSNISLIYDDAGFPFDAEIVAFASCRSIVAFLAKSSTEVAMQPGAPPRPPDAAWILKHRIEDLDPAAFSSYWPVRPNFVLELRSQTGRIRVLRDKMEEWLANGAQLAWLIDAEARTVEIYRPGFEAETRSGASSVAGEGPIDEFVVDLSPVWDPLSD